MKKGSNHQILVVETFFYSQKQGKSDITWIPHKIITWIVKSLINQCLQVEPHYRQL